ncbi:proton channel OTOP2 [Bombina bombina]|uniref:proton channel OTOP2 n=1 Tax=Bombina bombina TaxID=8345 RepID=UPI00235A5558|nr:proton channel OTOP2 [Bombina bombina]
MENSQDLHSSDSPSDNQVASSPTHQRPPEKWKKGGRLLSGLIGSNVLLFSCTLITVVFTKELDMWETDLLIYLSVLMLICILWMCFQMYFSYMYNGAVTYKDCRAGPIWMRGSIVLFGIGTIIMNGFRIINSARRLHCPNYIINIIHPAIHATFVIVQTYFLWVSCKHCVQMYVNSTRCGLMFLLTVNLTIWVIAVIEEARHHTLQMERYLEANSSVTMNTEHEEHSEISESSHCNSIRRFLPISFIYLYPFYIEYNLLSAAMVYIMWKNVGRQIDDDTSHHHGLGPGIREHIPIFGLFSGVTILVTGLVMFILYEVGREHNKPDLLSLTVFYYFHVISLSLMSLATMVGISIFRLDKRRMDNEKNPSRTLDMTLLLSTTLAQYGISYYSIIATVASPPLKLLSSLSLTYSLLMIVQHTLQNTFIIEGLHRLPPHLRLNSHGQSNHPTFQNRQGQRKHVTIQEMEEVSCVQEHEDPPIARRLSRRATFTAHIRKHLKKRKTLKDIYLFLFLSNIIFWILPAFGGWICFDTGLEVKFFGFFMWAVITNICLPFGIFYRMHAAANLLELYSMT